MINVYSRTMDDDQMTLDLEEANRVGLKINANKTNVVNLAGYNTLLILNNAEQRGPKNNLYA